MILLLVYSVVGLGVDSMVDRLVANNCILCAFSLEVEIILNVDVMLSWQQCSTSVYNTIRHLIM